MDVARKNQSRFNVSLFPNRTETENFQKKKENKHIFIFVFVISTFL